MALQRSYTTMGVTAASSYHRIGNIQIVYHTASISMSIIVERWFDSAARTAANGPLCHEEYIVTGDDADTYFSSETLTLVGKCPRERAYTYLKDKVDYYSDAADV